MSSSNTSKLNFENCTLDSLFDEKTLSKCVSFENKNLKDDKMNKTSYKILGSKNFTLDDFIEGDSVENCIKRIKRENNKSSKTNEFYDFIEKAYNTALNKLPKYSSKYNKGLYTEPALAVLVFLKIHMNTDYRDIINYVEAMTEVRRFLGLKQMPHYSTLQKFFKRYETLLFREVDEGIKENIEFNTPVIVMDGTGYTSENSDYYYSRRVGKKRKNYIKNHIVVDPKTQIIIHHNAYKGPKHDSTFAIAAVRAIKKYSPHYIAADKAYDFEELRRIINEEVGAFDIIPLKKNPKTGKYRLNSMAIFRKLIYGLRNIAETVNSVEKRKFSGTLRSHRTDLQEKEMKVKNIVYNIYRATKL